MGSRELIAESTTPGGEPLTLSLERGHYLVCVRGEPLMSSLAFGSEQKMAEVGCEGLASKPSARVLISGLGLGYTLRAALDLLGPGGRVVVVEFAPAVVEWNRGPVAHLADRPLDDPRVEVVVEDVGRTLARGAGPFDCILLDIDNGPEPISQDSNAAIYGPKGLARLRRALKPGGRVVIWSAHQCPPFPKALRRAGLHPSVVNARERGNKGARHTLYVGTRPGPAEPGRGGGKSPRGPAGRPQAGPR